MRSLSQLLARARRLSHRLPRFVSEDRGQDLIEYAFLAAFIGLTSYIALNTIVANVGDNYATWLDPNVGVPSAWDPPEPPGGGG